MLKFEANTKHTCKDLEYVGCKISLRYLIEEVRYRPLVKNAYQKNNFSTKTYVVGTQKNRLNETVLLSTQNIC